MYNQTSTIWKNKQPRRQKTRALVLNFHCNPVHGEFCFLRSAKVSPALLDVFGWNYLYLRAAGRLFRITDSYLLWTNRTASPLGYGSPPDKQNKDLPAVNTIYLCNTANTMEKFFTLSQPWSNGHTSGLTSKLTSTTWYNLQTVFATLQYINTRADLSRRRWPRQPFCNFLKQLINIISCFCWRLHEKHTVLFCVLLCLLSRYTSTFM